MFTWCWGPENISDLSSQTLLLEAPGIPRVYNTHVQISWTPWETTFKIPFLGSTMKVPGSLPCSWRYYIYIYLCVWSLTLNHHNYNHQILKDHIIPGSAQLQAGWSPLHVAAFMGRQDAVSVTWQGGKMMENIGTYPIILYCLDCFFHRISGKI